MDPSHGERLADYVSQKEKIPLTAMSFSSVEKLCQHGEEHVIGVLLVGENARGLVEDVKAKQIMVLCQEEPVGEKEEFPVIYKYQSGDCVMREVMARYCGQPMEFALALLGPRAVVIGIYSPVNRCLESSLALIMCRQMARQEAVLCMNLGEYSGFSKLVCDGYRAGLSDVLYLYRQGACNWMRLKSMMYNWGSMDYIPLVRYREDLSRVAPEEVTMFVDRTAYGSGYGKVVVDTGQMGHGTLLVPSVCDAVYMPVREDCVSATETEESEEYPEATDDGSIRGQIQRLRPPRAGSVIRREGYLEQLLFRELGGFVRQLLTKRGGFSPPLLIEELIAQPAPITRRIRKS